MLHFIFNPIPLQRSMADGAPTTWAPSQTCSRWVPCLLLATLHSASFPLSNGAIGFAKVPHMLPKGIAAHVPEQPTTHIVLRRTWLRLWTSTWS